MLDRSESIKSVRSEETAFSDASGSTLQAPSFNESKKDEEMGEKVIYYDSDALDNQKQASRPSWTKRAASSISSNFETVKNKASSVVHSVQDKFAKGGRQIGGGLKMCVGGCNIAVQSARQARSAIVKYFFKGLWMALCVWGYFCVEFFFAALFAMSAALLSLSIAVKVHAPVEPEDITRTTQSRLNLIMGFSIFMLLVVVLCVLIFEISGRGSIQSGCQIFLIEVILCGSWVFVGYAYGAGLSENSQDGRYPNGLQCTFGLSTPAPGLCEHVRVIKSLLLAEIIVIFVTFGAVGMAPVFKA
jgi:hypothetical protein